MYLFSIIPLSLSPSLALRVCVQWSWEFWIKVAPHHLSCHLFKSVCIQGPWEYKATRASSATLSPLSILRSANPSMGREPALLGKCFEEFSSCPQLSPRLTSKNVKIPIWRNWSRNLKRKCVNLDWHDDGIVLGKMQSERKDRNLVEQSILNMARG